MRFSNNMLCPLTSARASRALRHSRSRSKGRESHDARRRTMEPERCPAWRVFVASLSGLLCRVDLESDDATTLDLKRRISASFSIPSVEFDLIAPGARRMKPRDELSQYLLPGGDPTVTFARVSSRVCSTCGARSGIFDRKPKLHACRLCLDVFYCDRTCADAGFAKHGPDCHTVRPNDRHESRRERSTRVRNVNRHPLFSP